jgi:ATP-dependent helicase/DNAse subunit B
MVWGKLHDHATLISYDSHELNELIETSINEALDATPNSHSEFKQYISLEKQRLHHIISEWLKIEKERPPFTIMTHEKTVQFTLGQLPLTMRIDRIDELEDGTKLIIDYKTGKNNEINSWFSDRPEEPQLPLYSLLDPTHTSGITFAQIYPGEHCFKGVSHYAMDIKGIKLVSEIKKTTALSWGEQIQQWNNTLIKLSDDFYHGIAKVDPKDSDQTCTWCALQPLCRINEDVE